MELEMSQMMPEEADSDAEDILYSRDASISAHLDLGGEASATPPEAEQRTAAPPVERVRFVAATTTAAPPPCQLECGVGICLDVAAPGGRSRQQRCQCPLGRTGAHCEIGEYKNALLFAFFMQKFKMLTSIYSC
jgi:hypothetical protein